MLLSRRSPIGGVDVADPVDLVDLIDLVDPVGFLTHVRQATYTPAALAGVQLIRADLVPGAVLAKVGE